MTRICGRNIFMMLWLGKKLSILLHNALDEGLESLELRLGYQEASSKQFKLCKIQMT